jgi:hypothetical protein
MPPPGYVEVYSTLHSTAFIVAFASALFAGCVGLAFDVASQELVVRRIAACTSLVITALALLLSCWTVLHLRSLTNATLIGSTLSACDVERIRHVGYAQARASARLALWAAPLPLVVATLIAARSLRSRFRGALAWAAPAFALFVLAGCLYAQPLQGRLLWLGRCDFLHERDRILSSTIEEVRGGCYNLSEYLTHPKDLAYALGTDSLSVVLPELPTLQKRCIDDMLDEARGEHPAFSRRDVLNSPLLAPEARASVLERLDKIAPLKPWQLDAGAQPDDE